MFNRKDHGYNNLNQPTSIFAYNNIFYRTTKKKLFKITYGYTHKNHVYITNLLLHAFFDVAFTFVNFFLKFSS